VRAHVRDLAHPSGEMRLERRPADEAVAGDGIVFDVADATLVLALGPCPVRSMSGVLPATSAATALPAPQPKVQPMWP
jgi:hypothetical protein